MKKMFNIVPALGLAFLFTFTVYAENRGALTEIIPSPETGYAVIDTLDGVQSRYRTNAYPDYTGEFSCAGFIKTYYEAVYGIYVDNLSDAGPPRGRALSESEVQTKEIFMQADTPQKGDIIFYARPPHQNNHSAIVKSFDGSLITLIEQNFKWAQAGGTYTWLNRTIPYSFGNNNYQIWRLNYLQETLTAETPVPEAPAPEPFPYFIEEEDEEYFYIDNNPVIYEFIFNNNTFDEEAVPVFYETPGDIPPDDVLIVPIPDELDEPDDYPINEVVVGIGRPFILINGDPLFIESPAYIENNRMMMPVRYVSYALGLTAQDLHWDGPTRSVIIYNQGDEIRFGIESEVLIVNGEPSLMDTAAALTDGSAFLPVRFLAEAMGVLFEWVDETAAVYFYY